MKKKKKMLINLSYNKIIIQSKDVHYPDNVNLLNWMIEAYKIHFDLNISKYGHYKVKKSTNYSGTSSITIELEKEDIQIWRESRLTEILKK